MKTFLSATFVLITIFVTACSGLQKSFCHVKTLRPADNVICGVIVSKAPHSVQMNVIDVLSGSETRTVVTIWDGTDFDCNGNVSMKAEDLGKVGDTIIAILPVISAVQENSWDVTGDYRRPYSLFETAWLRVSNDSVKGFISSSPYTPVVRYSYTDFKSYWQNQNNDCMTLSVNKLNTENISVLLYENRIIFNSASGKSFRMKLHTIDGRVLVELSTDKRQDINCSHLPSGVYILTVSAGSETLLTRKIIL